MAITYPLSLPTLKVKRISIFATCAVGVVSSQFTFQQQVQVHAGKMLGAEITISPLKIEEAAYWNAFFLKLNGQEGTFLLGDPSSTTPRGVATGSPLVKGASQVAGVQSLITAGWTPSTTNILKANDSIQIGTGSSTEFYKVLSDVDSNGSGEATLDIFPGLRTSPADNAVIITSNCVGLFRLAENQTPIYATDETLLYDHIISCVEALP